MGFLKLNIENRKIVFFVFKPHQWSSKELPIVFCLAVIRWWNTCTDNSNFWPNGVIPTLRGRKRLKIRVKNWSKLSLFTPFPSSNQYFDPDFLDMTNGRIYNAITSPLRSHLPILGNKNSDVNSEGKRVKRSTTMNCMFAISPKISLVESSYLFRRVRFVEYFKNILATQIYCQIKSSEWSFKSIKFHILILCRNYLNFDNLAKLIKNCAQLSH